jgi:hypothetical protein
MRLYLMIIPTDPFGKLFGKYLGFLLPYQYRPVEVADLAWAIVRVATENQLRTRIIESGQILKLAKDKR